MNFDKNACLNLYAYELICLSRAKRRPFSEGPSNQDISIAERLVPRSREQFNFVFGSEILLEKNSRHLSLLTFSLRFRKNSVSFVDEIE